MVIVSMEKDIRLVVGGAYASSYLHKHWLNPSPPQRHSNGGDTFKCILISPTHLKRHREGGDVDDQGSLRRLPRSIRLGLFPIPGSPGLSDGATALLGASPAVVLALLL